MNLSYRTLLTISCVSFSLHSMEQATLTNNDNSTTNLTKKNQTYSNFYLIDSLYKKANSTLKNYNPNDLQCITDISDIITETKNLTDDNIEKKQIGRFAYKQAESIKNKIFSSSNPPHHGPQYVAIFFAKIEEYNNHLAKNKFTSPTAEQFIDHINNKKRMAAIEVAITFKLFIDLKKIDPENKIIIDIPRTVAAREFEELMNDIFTMQHVAPDIIKTLADILYGFDKEEELQNTADKL